MAKTVKDRTCKCCKNSFTPYKTTDVVCSVRCAIVLAKVKVEKDNKKAANDSLKLLKERFKDKHKKLSEYESEAKKAFQKWVRMRDDGLPCISCGTLISKPFWDGGHFKKAELFSGVIFNEDNCHRQCRKCNYFMNGNELAYRERLVIRIGNERVEALELLANETRTHKYTREDYVRIKKDYEDRIKKLA